MWHVVAFLVDQMIGSLSELDEYQNEEAYHAHLSRALVALRSYRETGSKGQKP